MTAFDLVQSYQILLASHHGTHHDLHTTMTPSHDLEMNDIAAHSGNNEPDLAGDHGNARIPLLASRLENSNSSNEVHIGTMNGIQNSPNVLHRVCPAGIASLTVQVPDSHKGTKRPSANTSKPASKPSRWNTTEFYCYYAIIALYLVLMIKTTVNLSRRKSQYSSSQTCM